ncbi:BTB/POZ domain-containing protein [Aphelenchoides avenae]|nr:BTB/POZ domain-containing protein [Aphelenchus avenae]
MTSPARQRGLLTLTIDNAREYFRSYPAVGNERKSQPVTLCGLRWHLEAYRKTPEGVPHVGAFVYCSSDGEDSRECKATCIFRIVSTSADDVVDRTCKEFVGADDNWGIESLLSVEDLLKPASGYIKNNTVTIECSITAFRSPVSDVAEGARGTKRRCTDVKLVAQDRAVYANKGVLAASCDYFEALFYGDFDDRHKDEIVLDDVKHADLVAFLEVVNPPCAPIDEKNLLAVLRLADRFGAKLFIEKCEQFIVDEIKLKDATIVLDGCNLLNDLKGQLLDKVNKEDLKSLCEEETYKQLSAETQLLVVKELKRHAFP